jgi:magnesium chelatase subunit D
MARPEYPLSAVVGSRRVKLALSLLAIDPLLKGLIIAGGRGSGKTVMARAIQPMLPAGAPFVEAPPSTTIDRLLGGADWTATLAGGKRRVFGGLLERANGGLLFSDHVNLVPIATVAQIATVLESGIVRLERDGLTSMSPTSFVWLATYDRDEGEPPSSLLDAVGLHAEMDADGSVDERESVAARALAFQSGPDEFAAGFAADARRHAGQVHAARQSLPEVSIDRDSKRSLCEWISELGVVGNRAEIFSVRAARAHAAFNGRGSVGEIDLRVASELVLEPRARAQAGQANRGSPHPTPISDVQRAGSAPKGGSVVVFRVPPIDNPAPPMSWETPRAGASDSGGKRSCRRVETDSRRGRYVGSLEADPGHGAISVDATLRAAAPRQQLRQQEGRRVRILPGDLRFKRFRRRTGVAIVIALDASGSMANNRIQQAKGAVIRLLREAYVHRDRVALVAFREARAELLMKLGRSVELASRALDELPAGGGTPLAAGILCALAEARRATCPTLLVLLTDGRPNVSGTGGPVWEELERVAEAVRQSKTVPIVIDTSRGHPAAEKLATMLGAQHLVLPHMNANALYQRVAEAALAMR